MTYSLKLWQNPNNDADVRLYINGTTRTAVYLKAADKDGRLVWSSKTNDTPNKYQTGDHWGKVRKDRAAAQDVCDAFGLRLGEDDWALALATAKGGLIVEAK